MMGAQASWTIAEVADAASELDEPAMCECGRHYVGITCDEAADIEAWVEAKLGSTDVN